MRLVYPLRKLYFTQRKCVLLFLVLSLPFLFFILVFIKISEPILFLYGWFAFTFVEYILHRFWMHNYEWKTGKRGLFHHKHHHAHPGELEVTEKHRLIFSLILCVSVILAFRFGGVLFFVAGFSFGFVYYNFMHVMLHRKIGRKVFPKLVAAHLLHHCKHPDKCFGVSGMFWDKVFNTFQPDSRTWPEKIIKCYSGDRN